MFLNIPFRRKESDFEPEPCTVATMVELSDAQFQYFKTHLLDDYDFLIENRDKMGYSKDGVRHCVLVLSESGKDGILVDAQGSNYARYAAYLPDAKMLYNLDRYWDLGNYMDDMRKIADACADKILQGQADGRYVLSIPKIKNEFKVDSLDQELLTKMLSTRDEFEIIDCYEGEITVAVTDDYVIKRDENLEPMSANEIQIELAKHLLWLNDEYGGKQLDLRNKYIEGFDFSKQEMNSAILDGSKFVNCSFYKTSLCFVEASGTRFNDCQMHDLTAEEGVFCGAEFRNCNLERGMYTHSNFANAKFIQSGVSGMVLNGSCLADAMWVDTDSTQARTHNTVDNIEDWDGEVPHQDIRME